MSVSYKKLWKLLIDKDLKKKDLCSMAGISSASVTKMGKGGTVLWSSFFVTFLANKIKLLSASILAVSATLDNGAEGYYQIVADSDDLKNRFFFLVSVK